MNRICPKVFFLDFDDIVSFIFVRDIKRGNNTKHFCNFLLFGSVNQYRDIDGSVCVDKDHLVGYQTKSQLFCNNNNNNNNMGY